MYSCPYHPQGNPCETFMKPLGKALKAAFFNRDCAQQAVDDLLQAYRSTPHPATGVPPGDMLFRHGYRSDFPRTTVTDSEVEEAVEKDRQQKHDRTQKTNSSPKRSATLFQVGDKVLLREYPRGKKFDPVYSTEPAEIISIEQKGVKVVDSSGKVKRRHKDDIKPYHEVPQSLWETGEEEEDSKNLGEALEEVGVSQGESQAVAVDAAEDVVDSDEPAGEAEEAPAVQHGPPNRPSRQRTLPTRLKDYVLRRVRRRFGGE